MAGLERSDFGTALLLSRRFEALLAIFLVCGAFAYLAWQGGVPEGGHGQAKYSEPAGEVIASRPLVQTFVATDDGIERVDLLLATYGRANEGWAVVRLEEIETGREVLAVAIDLATVEDKVYRKFAFPPQGGSTGKVYRLTVESTAARPGNAISLWYDPGNPYAAGEASLGDQPLPGDVTFRLFYRYSWGRVLADVVSAVSQHGNVISAAILLFVAPGWIAFLFCRRPGDVVAIIALTSATTVAGLPLLLLWSTLLGLRWDSMSARLLLAGAVLFVIAQVARGQLRSNHERAEASHVFGDGQGPKSTNSGVATQFLPALVVVLAFAIATWSKLLAVKDLPVGQWDDSVHHTLIAQLIVEHGQVPDSYLPYAPLTSFSYHFGFHALTAFFSWLTGIDVPRSVVLVGQLLNALSVAGLYAVTAVLTQNRWAGVAAGIAAGLISPMPSYYVNWGRYTQLAGQTILPVAILTTVLAVERRDRRLGLLSAVLVAGIAVTHFRVLAFYICLVAVYLVAMLYVRRRQWTEYARDVGFVAAIGSVALVLSAPWLWNQFTVQGNGTLASMLQPVTGSREQWIEAYNAMDPWEHFLRKEVMLVAAAGLGIGLWRYRRSSVVVALWMISLLVLANTYRLGLPGAGFVNNFSVQIMFYIPVGILFGIGVGVPVQLLVARLPVTRLAFTLGLLGVAVYTAGMGVPILDERFTHVRAEDLPAMAWIRENTPADARFLVNCYVSQDNAMALGSDAGWWLPVLAGRANTLPPHSYNTERSSNPSLRAETLELCNLSHLAFGDGVISRLRQLEVTHVYVGAAGGAIELGSLQNNPKLERLYSNGSAHVYALK